MRNTERGSNEEKSSATTTKARNAARSETKYAPKNTAINAIDWETKANEASLVSIYKDMNTPTSFRDEIRMSKDARTIEKVPSSI